MAVAEKDFNELVSFVDELAARVESLEIPQDVVAGEVADDDISDATVKDWVKNQIALAGGQYVSEPAPEKSD